MGELTVIKPGLQAQIQDLGRPGLAFYAVPESGPLDRPSARLANVLLNNKMDAPVLECHFVPPTLKFEDPATICLTGADMCWTINQRPVNSCETVLIESGSVLEGRASRVGCRAYIGIRGFIDTERTFGSASCCAAASFGGNDGRVLARGDTIRWQEPASPLVEVRVKRSHPRTLSGRRFLFIRGPEFSMLNLESQKKLFDKEFQMTPAGNRMGVRLAGPILEAEGRGLHHSVPVLPGIIQLPQSGQPIVVLNDGQTTGGYPRIGYLPSSELPAFCQLKPGDTFQFELDS